MSKQRVRTHDEGGVNVSTEVAAFHCSAEWHLTRLGKYATPTYALALRVQQPYFFGSAPQVAQYLMADDKTIRKVFDKLAEVGFFEEIEVRDGQTTKYRALTHTEWAQRHPDCCVTKREKGSNPTQSVERVGSQAKANPTQSLSSPLPNERVDTLPNGSPDPTQSVGTMSPKEVSEKVEEGVEESNHSYPTPPLKNGPGLQDIIVDNFPTPVLQPYSRKGSGGTIVGKCAGIPLWQPPSGVDQPARIKPPAGCINKCALMETVANCTHDDDDEPISQEACAEILLHFGLGWCELEKDRLHDPDRVDRDTAASRFNSKAWNDCLDWKYAMLQESA